MAGRTSSRTTRDAVQQPQSMADLWLFHGYVRRLCGGAAVLVTQTVTGGFSGGEANSPSQTCPAFTSGPGASSRRSATTRLQAGGGWDEVNYTADLRQGTVTFSGASTATSPAIRVRPASVPPFSDQLPSPALVWPISCSTIPIGNQAQRAHYRTSGRYRQRLSAGQLEDDFQT